MRYYEIIGEDTPPSPTDLRRRQQRERSEQQKRQRKLEKVRKKQQQIANLNKNLATAHSDLSKLSTID